MGIGFHTFPSGKKYVFASGRDGSRTFLRNILILSSSKDPRTIVVVREWGARGDKGVWEPPKGQMEWKEFAESGVASGDTLSPHELTLHQRRGVLREMMEEAKILPSEVQHLRKLPLVYKQEWKDAGIPGAYFMYQYWHGTITPSTLLEAQKRMGTLVRNKEWKSLLPPDMTEKDDIQWWNPDRDGWDKIRGAFSKKMTELYFDSL